MPYLEVNTSLKFTDAEKHELCEEIGKFISLIPGKRREITMMNIRDGCFTELGDSEHQKDPCLSLEFRILGRTRFNCKRDFVKDVTAMLGEKYGLKSNRVFINIFECESWGAFGKYTDNMIIDADLYD
jgi:phenylpyruvate tautomerase PptA (4-oxalocrotonate tautomerase family)